MTAPSHIGIGMVTFVAICRLGNVTPTALDVLAIIFGSLLPDLDGNGSLTRPGTILARFLPRFLVDLLDSVGELLSSFLRLLFGHRGAMHWPIIPIVLLIIGAYNQNDFLCWLSLGYLLHLIADLFTTGGIPLFGPFSCRRYSFSPLRTGLIREGVICLVIWFGVFVFGYPLLP